MEPRGGHAKKGWLGQFLRFAAVGLSSSAIELIIYNALFAAFPTRNSGILVIYSTLSVVAAVTNSFYWDKRWAFRSGAATSPQGAKRQRILFFVQGGANVGVNDLVLLFTAPLLLNVHALPAFVASNLAKVFAMSSSSLFSFVVLKLFVFRVVARHDG